MAGLQSSAVRSSEAVETAAPSAEKHCKIDTAYMSRQGLRALASGWTPELGSAIAEAVKTAVSSWLDPRTWQCRRLKQPR